MEQIETIARYRAAFSKYLTDQHGDGVYEALRKAACDVTNELRAADWPIEAIIDLLKAEAKDLPGPSTYMVRDTLTILVADAVKCFYEPERPF
jgi:hypothetical protein